MIKVYGDAKPSLEDALAHHGVKGMRWGQHIKDTPSSGQSNHQLNKASRQKDRAARKADNAAYNADRNATIDAARTRVRSGATRATYKEAKAQYKIDKKTIGTREARKKLQAARIARNTDHENAQMVKSGAETVGHVLGIVGGVALTAAVGGAAAGRRPSGGYSQPRVYRTTAYVNK